MIATAPGSATPAPLTTSPAVPLDPSGVAINTGVPSMPSTFVPAFVELTGAGPSLSTINANAADAAVGKILTGIVAGQVKNYQVRAGTDAQDLPGIVHPLNYNVDTNAVVFVQA
jgi:hypothetical protein